MSSKMKRPNFFLFWTSLANASFSVVCLSVLTMVLTMVGPVLNREPMSSAAAICKSYSLLPSSLIKFKSSWSSSSSSSWASSCLISSSSLILKRDLLIMVTALSPRKLTSSYVKKLIPISIMISRIAPVWEMSTSVSVSTFIASRMLALKALAMLWRF